MGIILAHTALATPFVVITVTATLMSFDRTLMRAGASCGAPPQTVFFKVVLPLILPGRHFRRALCLRHVLRRSDRDPVYRRAGTAHVAAADVSGIREQISPTITAAASVLIVFSTILLVTVELLRRRGERLRGIKG